MKIMFLHRDRLVHRMLSKTLQSEGHKVTSFDDDFIFLRNVLVFAPDVVICSNQSWTLSAQCITGLIRRLSPNSKVIMCGSHDQFRLNQPDHVINILGTEAIQNLVKAEAAE